MIEFAKIGFFLAIILVLISSNFWLLENLLSMVRRPGSQIVLAPVDYGSTEAEKARGLKTARHALAKVAAIQAQLEQTFDYLRTVESGPTKSSLTQDVSLARPIISRSSGGAVFEPLDVKIAIGGVEIGGIVSRVYGWFASDQLDRFTVIVSGSGETAKAVIAGSGPSLNEPILIEGAPADDKSVGEAIAYGIAQRRFAEMFGGRYRSTRALRSYQSFRDFIDAMTIVVGLDVAERAGVLHNEAAYAEALKKIKPFADSMDWLEVVEIAGRLAQRAKDKPLAIGFYERAVRLATEGSTRQVRLMADLATLKQETTVAARTAAATPGASFEDALKGVDQKAFSLALLKLPAPHPDGPASVGVVGAKPAPWTGNTAGARPNTLPAYTSAMGQIIRAFAGENSPLIFGEMETEETYFTEPIFLADLKKLIARKPRIVLAPYRIAKSIIPAFKASPDTLFVIPVGNESKSTGGDLSEVTKLSNVFLVGAVGPDGQKASFSNDHPDAFWAPGVGLPVLEPGLAVDAMSGTGPAAAAFAGALARVLGANSRHTPEDVRKVLRSAEKPQAPASPRLVDFEAAAKELADRG